MVPVILFPNASSTLSKSADALLFMTLLNSNSTKYLIREQLKQQNISLKIILKQFLQLFNI